MDPSQAAQAEQQSASAADRAGHIAVVVRVRPLVGPAEKDEKLAVTCADGRIQVCWQRERIKEALCQDTTNILTRPTANAKHFDFGTCLDGNANQRDVYAACKMSDLVKEALAGYAVTTFAFGQTGAGKTYSLLGSPEALSGARPVVSNVYDRPGDVTTWKDDDSQGLLPRAFRDAFDELALAQQSGGVRYSSAVSIMEIYNEKVVDLLASSKSDALIVRHSVERGFYADGLLMVPCATVQQAMKALKRGLARRSVRAQQMNACSSRSHCIVTLHLPCNSVAETASADGQQKRQGRLCFVDLAGSERLKNSGSAGQSLQETGNINRSLFTLGKVIAALSSKGRDGKLHRRGSLPSFVPYRDSKLTQLLGDGLSGSGCTLMLACCSPTPASAEETLQTLQYASMALHVRSDPVIVLDPQDRMLADLRSTIRTLKQENERLQEQLLHLQKNGQPTTAIDTEESEEAVSERQTSEMRASTSASAFGDRHVRAGRSQLSSQSASLPSISKGRSGSVSPGRRQAVRSAPARALVETSKLRSTYGQPLRRRTQKPLQVSDFSQLEALEKAFEKLKQAQSERERVEETNEHQEIETSADGISQGQAARARVAKPGQKASLARQHGGIEGRLKGMRPRVETHNQKVQDVGKGVARKRLVDIRNESASPNIERGNQKRDEELAQPEPKAAEFARRNPWFGTDQAMTLAAYEVHDRLVQKGLDPASDAYYAEIESDVRQKFPEYFAADERGLQPSEIRSNQQSPSVSDAAMEAAHESVLARLEQQSPEPLISETSDVQSDTERPRSLPALSTGRSSPTLASPGESLENLADAFRREREAIVESLHRAQREAEAEKETILAQIQEALKMQTSVNPVWT